MRTRSGGVRFETGHEPDPTGSCEDRNANVPAQVENPVRDRPLKIAEASVSSTLRWKQRT